MVGVTLDPDQIKSAPLTNATLAPFMTPGTVPPLSIYLDSSLSELNPSGRAMSREEPAQP